MEELAEHYSEWQWPYEGTTDFKTYFAEKNRKKILDILRNRLRNLHQDLEFMQRNLAVRQLSFDQFIAYMTTGFETSTIDTALYPEPKK